MGMKAPMPAAPPAYDWTGFYLEVHGGYGFSWAQFNLPAAAGNIGQSWQTDGGFGGGGGGFNYEFGASHIVAGLEAEWNASSLKGSSKDLTLAGVNHTATVDEFGSVDGRLGVALVGFPWDKILLYIVGGVAFGDPQQTVSNARTTISIAGGESTGWDFGAGLEFALSKNWTARGEWRMYNFPSTSFAANTVVAFPFGTETTVNIARGGFGYKF